MLYLASPYSDPDPSVREARYRAACRAAAELIRHGVPVFSPIAYSHPLAAFGLPGDWAFWASFDRAFIEACSEVRVLALPGWRESRGVRAELRIARSLRKPVSFIKAWPSSDQTPAALLRAGAVGS